MKTVTVGKWILGEGKPKICVPLTGRDRESLLAQARDLPAETQIAEWRADYDCELEDPRKVCETGALLAKLLGSREIPILFTCRSRREGGLSDLSPAACEELVLAAVEGGFASLVDVEYSSGEVLSRVLSRAKERGVAVIASSHDFEKTPSEEELFAKMTAMAETGADLVKVAVMPQKAADVLALLSATDRARGCLPVPLITMSMGSLGVASRVFGETFGSAVTFASAGEASAPGQLPAREMARYLEVFRP